ncbi:hypothetical protein UFOVP207_53 [uncultured Caudovirales phage]|uniref:Uncharacterized protein n=1 Tax=uncultured Caudovirales phage TaxID=2100421 RepID=A0A6J7WMZ3_9CAUD|nr:hypothetical protein UFOVP207_53 [uncultured Caudovirales phage]
MKGYYDIITQLESTLITDVYVNQVTKGSLDNITNAKKDMYPLAHLMINSAKIDGPTVVYNITILVMDLVDYSKADPIDLYFGNSNQDDVLHNTFLICQNFFESARRGNMSDMLMSIENENADLEPFVERFTDDVAGWSMTFDMTTQNDMTIC